MPCQFIVTRRIVVFVLGQRDVETVCDENYAHLTVGQVPGGLKEGNGSNRPRLSRSLDHGRVRPGLAYFVDTGGPEWQSKQR